MVITVAGGMRRNALRFLRPTGCARSMPRGLAPTLPGYVRRGVLRGLRPFWFSRRYVVSCLGVNRDFGGDLSL